MVQRIRLLAALLLLLSALCLPGCHDNTVVKSGADAPRHPPGVGNEDVNPPGNGPDTAGPKK